MKPINSSDAPEFEEQARRLLARYAESMPAEASVEARVRSQLSAQEPQRHTAFQWRAPRWGVDDWARGAVSLALVIVLVAGFAAVLRARQSTAQGTNVTGGKTASCAKVEPNHTIKLCAEQQVGATITLGEAYADPTRTEVEIHLSLTGAKLQFNGDSAPSSPAGVFPGVMTLQDSQGNLYSPNEFSVGFNYGQETISGVLGPNTPTPGFAAFDPLPHDMLGAPQTLTLHIASIGLQYNTPQYKWTLSTLIMNGPWTFTFQVTPQAGRSITFNVAPQTFSGITLQPLRMDIGPKDGNDFDYLGGGERLVLRVSGLAPDTRRSTVAAMPFKFFDKLGRGAAAEGSDGLHFEGQLPASVAGMTAIQPASLALDPEAGASGTLDLEVIFLGLPKVTGTQMLTINQLATSRSGDAVSYVKGNWSFQLPLG
ncbi:MAG TPA: hypothetical protein VHI51_21480 [Ktedonobacterales bacterium]|jgi:hypothetical protein|nr:hypothetical protein [Ktedonobacterales bacterium]